MNKGSEKGTNLMALSEENHQFFVVKEIQNVPDSLLLIAVKGTVSIL